MLRKIYQELVAIRKELQDIKNIIKPYSVDVFIGDEKIAERNAEGRVTKWWD